MAKSNSPISLFWMLPDSTSIFCERLWPIKVTLISRRTESSWIFPPTSAVLNWQLSSIAIVFQSCWNYIFAALFVFSFFFSFFLVQFAFSDNFHSIYLIAGRVIPDSSEFTWHCSVWASLVFTAVKQSCGLTKLQSDLTQRTCSSLSWSLIIPKTVSSATVAILPYLVFFLFLFSSQWRIQRGRSLRQGGGAQELGARPSFVAYLYSGIFELKKKFLL